MGAEVQIPAERIPIFFNGWEILLENPSFYAGAALLAASGKSENLPASSGPPYLFCGNGACRDCNLNVDGIDDVASCQLPLAPSMSFRPGEGAGEENALSRNLRGLERGKKELLEVSLLIVGAGLAGSAALEAARGLGIDAVVFDARADRGTPRPVAVRERKLVVALDGFVREVRAAALILATGAREGRVRLRAKRFGETAPEPEGPRREPQLALAKALGCGTTYDRALRYERLELDSDGRTSIPGVFAAGDAARVGSESEARESGRRAGETAALDVRGSS